MVKPPPLPPPWGSESEIRQHSPSKYRVVKVLIPPNSNYYSSSPFTFPRQVTQILLKLRFFVSNLNAKKIVDKGRKNVKGHESVSRLRLFL